MDDLQALIGLTFIDKLGPVNGRNLISWCGGAAAVFRAGKGKLMRVPGIGATLADMILKADPLKRAEEEISFAQRNGIRIISFTEKDYPVRLSQIWAAPLVLYQRGRLNLNDRPAIAIVGTRTPTESGVSLAESFAAYFSRFDIHIVSGLALGIDIAAHRAAIHHDGVTTGVLGHGLDRIYPACHASTARRMLERGSLLTEFPSGTKPDAGNFPSRNRVVSGLCNAVIVIEAWKKGGALITAKYAFEQDRAVYAVPGDLGKEESEGCNHIIRDQIARLITAPEEVLEDLNLRHLPEDERQNEMPKAFQDITFPLSAEERKILDVLSKGDALVDYIHLQTGIAIGSLMSLLLTLEFKGAVKQLPGKKFRRV